VGYFLLGSNITPLKAFSKPISGNLFDRGGERTGFHKGVEYYLLMSLLESVGEGGCSDLVGIHLFSKCLLIADFRRVYPLEYLLERHIFRMIDPAQSMVIWTLIRLRPVKYRHYLVA